ncbi:TPA: two-component system response regulator [Candidatus Gastranaerophilales bacterium HUM_21]|nr:MAG TPA: two-component system response regulator [Candidatus Gastranaerophilales bacterium HUM_21]
MENFALLKEDSFEESLGEILQVNPKNEKHTILLVDDEVNNLQLLRRTLRHDYNILTASNGKEALEIVEGKGSEIALIVSDQKMPEMEGTEFLKRVAGEYPDIVKILLTGHLDVDAIVDSINDCHLYQYIVKPFDPEELKLTIETGIQKFDLVNNKTVILKDLRELFYKTIKLIASALDAKDPYTHGHSLRVTMYSLILAKKLNLDDTTLEEIETAGLLHDIGKIGIPQSILCKPGKLTDEEYEVMKSHPAQAEKMLMGIKKLTVVSNWLRTHHERWDGKGYPYGLKGEEIPISGRIIALADTYDAMTSTRSYRKALSHETAMEEIKRCAGTQFDPVLADLFISCSDEIRAAKDDPDTYYPKYSYLQKMIYETRYSKKAHNA